MPKFCDLTGRKFGRLTVLNKLGRNTSKRYVWECVCSCGNTCKVDSGCLVSGNTVSCGCYLKERITKHGGSKKASYNTWRAMMRRCYNKATKDYYKYGGTGISVYGPWHDYTEFARDMGEPTGSQTLDRVDPYGDYEPKNCRWASLATQARNKRTQSNKSGHKGIYLTDTGKWMAAITAKKKKYYGPCRDLLEDALLDRKNLERMHWDTE